MLPNRRSRFPVLASILALIALACVCESASSTVAPTPTQEPVASQPLPELEGYWQWRDIVFTIAWEDDEYRVLAANDSRNGPLDLAAQAWDGNTLTWQWRFLDAPTTIAHQSVQGDVLTADISTDGGKPRDIRLWRAASKLPRYFDLPYSEDFDDPRNGWGIDVTDSSETGYDAGSYYVTALSNQIYATARADRFFRDVVVDVDITPASGPSPELFSYGVDCHAQADGTGYSFEIRGDGSYVIWLRTSAEAAGATKLTGDQRLASASIHQGMRQNHIRATCASGLQRLEVNGQLLAETYDDTFLEGDVSLFAGTDDPSSIPAMIRFDNLLVAQPSTAVQMDSRDSSATLPYFDDFSDPRSGWDSYESEARAMGYDGGSYYLIDARSDDNLAATAYNPGIFADAVIDVDAMPITDPGKDSFAYGVACRVQPDGTGYYFEILGNRQYEVYSLDDSANDIYTVLSGDQSQSSGAVLEGFAPNHLRATCAGSLLRLEVNGQLVWEGQDAAFAEGHIAFRASTWDDAGTPVKVRFDNLLVTAP